MSNRYFMSSISNYFSPKIDTDDVILLSPSAAERANLKLLRGYSDADYGGGSCCSVDVRGEDLEGKGGDDLSIRFAGSLVFTEEHALKTKAKSGFCAMRAIFKKVVDLRDYEGLEIIMKCDRDQSMLLNMNCLTYVVDEVYQLHMDIAGSKDWKTLYVPFSLFRATHRGHVKEDDRANDSLRVEGMGLLINKCDHESFTIDIQSIKAIEELPGGVPQRISL